MSEQGFMARCLELEAKLDLLDQRNKKLVSALIMAKQQIPEGMKAERQQIDEALKD